MAGNSLTLKYVINLTGNLIKQATANSKAIEQAAKRQQQAMQATDRAMQRSAQTQNLVARNNTARAVLSIRSEQQIQRQIAQTVAAYNRLARAGFKSASDQQRAYQAMRQQVAQLNQELGKTTRLQRTMGMLSKGMRGAAAFTTGAVAAGYTADRMLEKPIAFDDMMRDMSNTVFGRREDGTTAGMKERAVGLRELEDVVKNAVAEGKGTKEGAAALLNELIASGAFKKEQVYQMLPDLQKAVTGTGASPEEMAAIAIRATQNYGLKPEEIGPAISKAIVAGQEGGFELKDMARWLPQMMAASKGMLGMQGMEGFEKLLAYSQASVITAGTKDEAGNNLVNLLAKINSRDTAQDFEKLKIDLPKSLARAMEQGNAPVDAFVNFVEQIAMRDKQFALLKAQADKAGTSEEKKQLLEQQAQILEGSAIGQVIQDRQALMALLALMQNKDYVKNVETAVKNEQGKELEASYQFKTAGVGGSLQDAKNQADLARQDVFHSIEGPLKGVLDSVTELSQEFPILTTAVTGAAQGFGLLGAAGLGGMIGGGLLFKGGAAATGGGILARLGAFFGLGGAGTATAGTAGATGGTAASGGLLAGALPWLAAASPLAIMGYVAHEASDTSKDQSRAEALGHLADRLGQVLQFVGFNKDAEIQDRYQRNRAELNPDASEYINPPPRPQPPPVPQLPPMPNFGAAMAMLNAQALNQTVANMAAAAKEPQKVEIKDGKLAVAVTVRDDRTDIRTWVTQQLSHIQINAGATNPGGAGGGK